MFPKGFFAGVHFRKIAGLKQFPERIVGRRTESLQLKKRLQHSCFPAKSVKFLRRPFFTGHL